MFFKKVFLKLYADFFEDKNNWLLWIPVFFSLGIFFGFLFKINLIFPFIICVLLFFLSWFFYKSKKFIFVIPFILGFIFLGYIRTGYYTKNLKAPVLSRYTGKVEVFGKVVDVLLYDKEDGFSKKVILKPESIKKIGKINFQFYFQNSENSYFDEKGIMQNLPYKVRINLKDNQKTFQNGDKIKIQASLMSLPTSAYPGAYSFKKYAYFKQIGGIGYNGKVLEVQKREKKFLDVVGNFRNNYSTKITSVIGQPSGGIGAALLTGNKGFLKESVSKNMIYSGLAHLLAISGLHIAIVVSLIFLLTRKFLSYSEKITLNYNIKKIAAVCALVASFFYLLVTGMPVSAQRAYMMIALFLIAIIIDRNVCALRSVMLVGLIMLFYKPDFLFSPGFQMSFAAVIGLVSGFRFLKSCGYKLYTENKFAKPFVYLGGVMIGSVIAEICITPFIIYHFNNYSPYGLLANLIAMPLTTFIIVPLGMVSYFLIPFNLDFITLKLMGYAIDVLLWVAQTVAFIPGSNHVVMSPSNVAMGLIIFGGLWFWLWSRKWRYFGIPIFIIGVVLAFFKPIPDLILNEKKVFGVLDGKGNLYFSQKLRSEYIKDIWLKKTGNTRYKLLNDFPDNDLKKISCNNHYCLITKYDKKVYLATSYHGIKEGCRQGDVVVNMDAKHRYLKWIDCEKPKIKLNYTYFKNNGAAVLFLKEDEVKLK